MSVTYQEEILDNGLRMLSVSGTLDAPSSMAIEEAFLNSLLSDVGQIIVNLRDVDYISSYGLRMLMVGAKGLNEGGGGLHLAAANDHVMEVIRVAGYDTMFPVYESVDDAISKLSG